MDANEAAASPARILVVDDEPLNLTAFGRMLRGTYEVLAAPSGERALEIVAAEPRPDLILLDLKMPRMSGLQVLKRLQEDPLTHAIPVILVTVMDSMDDHEDGLLAGAVDYIAKPFSPHILRARIATHLALKRKTDELAACREALAREIARNGALPSDE